MPVSIAMARERIVLFVLDGVNSNPVTRLLWSDCPFGHIFGDYVDRAGYNVAVTSFFFTRTQWLNWLVLRGISALLMVAGSM